MIQGMNNVLVKHSKFVYGVFAIVIIVSFVWFLTPGANGGLFFEGKANELGTVMGDKIVVKDVQATYEYTKLQGYAQYYSVDKDHAKDFRPEFNDESMFYLTAMRLSAEKFGYRVSDSEIQEIIKEFPAFQKDGKFSLDLYAQFKKDVLEPNGYDFKKFEEAIGKALIIEKFRAGIVKGISVTEGEVKEKEKQLSPYITVVTYQFDSKNFKGKLSASEAEIKAEYEKNGKDYMSDAIIDAWVATLDVKDIKDEAKKTAVADKFGKAAKELKALKTVTKADLDKFVKETGAKLSEAKNITPKSPATATLPLEVISEICTMQKVGDVVPVRVSGSAFAIAVASKVVEPKLLPLDKELKAKIKDILIERKALKAASEAAKQCHARVLEKKLAGKDLEKEVLASKGTVGTKDVKQRIDCYMEAQGMEMQLNQIRQYVQNNPQFEEFFRAQIASIQRVAWMCTAKAGAVSKLDTVRNNFQVVDAVSVPADLTADQKEIVRNICTQEKYQQSMLAISRWFDDNVVRYDRKDKQGEKQQSR